MKSKTHACSGPVGRREALTAGVLGVGGLTLPDFFRMQARAEEAGRFVDRQTSVIFVWLPGGPPHMDMYDMKPEASSDYRGAFRPIPTNVPGLDVCELMPCGDRRQVRCGTLHLTHFCGSWRWSQANDDRANSCNACEYSERRPCDRVNCGKVSGVD